MLACLTRSSFWQIFKIAQPVWHYCTVVGICIGTSFGWLQSIVLLFHIGCRGCAFGSGCCGLIDVSLNLWGTWFSLWCLLILGFSFGGETGWLLRERELCFSSFARLLDIYTNTGVVTLAVCWVEDESFVNKLEECQANQNQVYL
jgi:hypothetical protein